MGGAGKGRGPHSLKPRGGPSGRGESGLLGFEEWGGGGGRAPRGSDTCAGSPERRASGTGPSLEVGPVRARRPGQRPAPPQSLRREPGHQPKPPSSAAARVAEARECRVEPERRLELGLGVRRRGRSRRSPGQAEASCGGPGPFIAGENGPLFPFPPPPRAGRSGTRSAPWTHVPKGEEAPRQPTHAARTWRPPRPTLSSQRLCPGGRGHPGRRVRCRPCSALTSLILTHLGSKATPPAPQHTFRLISLISFSWRHWL